MKKPALHGFSLNHWRVGTPCGKVYLSKRFGRDDSTLYTFQAENRNRTALVSFQSHFQERCKQDYVTGRIIHSCNTGSRRTLQNDWDSGLLNTLIQLGERHSINVPDIDWKWTRGRTGPEQVGHSRSCDRY